MWALILKLDVFLSRQRVLKISCPDPFMNILIRLPNWLGDMVMSTAFVQAVRKQYPDAAIDLLAKKGIDDLLERFPAHRNRFVFSKAAYPGLRGAWKFGRMIARQQSYDLFFCLPNSLSSAVMGRATGAKKRIGYKKELRDQLLTHAFTPRHNIHRAEAYIDLLKQFRGNAIPIPAVTLTGRPEGKKNAIVININSEAGSRRLPAPKAVSLISAIQQATNCELILTGSPAEKAFVDSVFAALPDQQHISNLAGQCSLLQLADLFASCPVVLSTDSGPAHLANALGAFTIVLFGAGNENNTAPYNKGNCKVIRLGQLPCEPCTKNTCNLYTIPECLMQLNENIIVQEVLEALK